MSRYFYVVLILLSSSGTLSSNESRYSKEIRPLLESYCIQCHGSKKQKAKLRLDTLRPDFTDNATLETWHDILNKVQQAEMPPEKEKQLSSGELQAFTDWLNEEIEKALKSKQGTEGRAVFRRLTRYEYQNTLEDLLGVEGDFSSQLPPESNSPEGFKNNREFLGMAPIQLEAYFSIARQALNKAIVRGEKPEVIEKNFIKSEKPSRRTKVNTGKQIFPGEVFLAKLQKFPRRGVVKVKVRAKAHLIEGSHLPRMEVTIGLRSDVKSFAKTIGVIDFSSQNQEFLDFEFTGRIEDFPLPGHNPKFPGVSINVWHVDPFGLAPKKRRTKKKKGEEEPLPKISSIMIDSVTFQGPINESWPPITHQNIFIESENKADEVRYAKEVLGAFMKRAFRREVRPEELKSYIDQFVEHRKSFPSFEEAIQETLVGVLVSPDFLYLVEFRHPFDKKNRVEDHELATRISYFLWSSMPDLELFEMAENGAIRDTQQLTKKVRSMLQDERMEEFIQHFTSQWLNLDGLDRVAVNPEYYPNFDDQLKKDMKEETIQFFKAVLNENRSALNFIDSDFTLLNNRLAKHYNLEGPKGLGFEKVLLQPEDRRGGLLTQASVLLVNSNGEDSHPIKRAVWLLDRLLGSPPAPPPPDVPELASEEPNFKKLPLAEQLKLHRKKAACNNCHQKIDPWGIPFENYDAVGNWRELVTTKSGKKPKKNNRNRNNRAKKNKNSQGSVKVQTESQLPSGKQIADLNELKKHLLVAEKDRFSHSLVEKVLSYALGRSLSLRDRKEVEKIQAQFAEKDYRLSDLLVLVIQSKVFQSK